MKLEAIGIVENGALQIYHRKVFDAMLERFNGKEVRLQVTKKRKNRSNPQNKYYWGVVIPIIQNGLFETQGEWINANETHEFLKTNFNYKELVNESTGEVLKLAQTTTTKTTVEFEEYLDKCRAFALEFLNIEIPLPNEQIEINI